MGKTWVSEWVRQLYYPLTRSPSIQDQPHIHSDKHTSTQAHNQTSTQSHTHTHTQDSLTHSLTHSLTKHCLHRTDCSTSSMVLMHWSLPQSYYLCNVLCCVVYTAVTLTLFSCTMSIDRLTGQLQCSRYNYDHPTSLHFTSSAAVSY
jgi:hypothetical protein